MPICFKHSSNDNTAHDIGMQPGEGGVECADEGNGVHLGTLEHVERDQHVEHDQAREDQEHDVAPSGKEDHSKVLLNIFTYNWCIN